MAVGDFNRDGLRDVAIGHRGYNGGKTDVTILLGQGTGGYSSTPAFTILFPAEVFSLVQSDFNQDGWPDLAVGITGYASSTAPAPGTKTVVVVLNQGASSSVLFPSNAGDSAALGVIQLNLDINVNSSKLANNFVDTEFVDDKATGEKFLIGSLTEDDLIRVYRITQETGGAKFTNVAEIVFSKLSQNLLPGNSYNLWNFEVADLDSDGRFDIAAILLRDSTTSTTTSNGSLVVALNSGTSSAPVFTEAGMSVI